MKNQLFTENELSFIVDSLNETFNNAVRKLETKAISDLVDYAKAKGSKSADMCYTNITKMTNKLLGIESGTRDNLDARTLGDIAVMEKIVSNAVSDGINAGLDYKEIFQLAKNRCKIATPAIGIM